MMWSSFRHTCTRRLSEGTKQRQVILFLVSKWPHVQQPDKPIHMKHKSSLWNVLVSCTARDNNFTYKFTILLLCCVVRAISVSMTLGLPLFCSFCCNWNWPNRCLHCFQSKYCWCELYCPKKETTLTIIVPYPLSPADRFCLHLARKLTQQW